MPAANELLLAVLVLVTFVVAARSFMAWRRLAVASSAIRLRSERLEHRTLGLAESIARLRRLTAQVDAGLERGLWAMARFDEQTERVRQNLSAHRASSERFRTRQVVAADGLLRRGRSAVRLIELTINLRRSFWA